MYRTVQYSKYVVAKFRRSYRNESPASLLTKEQTEKKEFIIYPIGLNEGKNG
jgi:hypothetical protein